MAEEVKVTETNAEPITTQEVKVIVEDLEAKNAMLEAEKAKIAEKAENYRLAYLKEKNKPQVDQDEDEKMRLIAQEAVERSHLAEVVKEQQLVIAKALKENKELKIAQANKTDVSLSTTSHSEPGAVVRDTLVTKEQMDAFKARGWSDKDIDRYKKNLLKNAVR